MRSPERAATADRPPPAAPIPPVPVGRGDYAELSRLVKQAGLLERRRWRYAWRITVTAVLLVAVFGSLVSDQAPAAIEKAWP